MTSALKVRLLGGMVIEKDEQPLTDLASRKTEALFIYLIVTRRAHAREILGDLLWDTRSQQQSLSNLRVVLSSLRKHLEPFVTITRQTVSITPDSPYGLDTDQFREAIALVRRRWPNGRALPDEAIQHLEEAVALYRGDFLEGFYVPESRGFEEWALVEREYLRYLMSQALSDLSAHYTAVGEYELGLPHTLRLLELDALHETAHRRLMLLLARSGQRNEALQQYEQCRAILAEELGVEPAEPTTDLYHWIRSGTVGANNLPPPTTPFVGREEELSDLERRLSHADCRLLTLLGSGGVGKTRLALQIARVLLAKRPGQFLHGIWFVSLASVTTPNQLTSALADSIGLTFHSGAPPESQLLRYLQRREMLLVLDNVEQLLGNDQSVTWLTSLLLRAPDVKVLVTSRERLHLQEEWIFDLGGLSYPPDGAVETASAYSAPQLFLQSAQRVDRAFQPDETTLAALVRVCRLVEGLPLAIELAAAWVRHYSCEEIAQRIAQSPDFLSTSLRNVPLRHRSIRAVFEHSWALLSDTERVVARRLSLFHGPFQQAAAETVAQCAPAFLGALVDKSLLSRNQKGYLECHALLRDFLSEKAADFPAEICEARARHATFYATILAAQQEKLRGHDQSVLLEQLSRELSNVRAAWQWAVAQRAVPLLLQMGTPLFLFYESRGRFQEGEALFAETVLTLGTAREAGEAHLLSTLLARQGRLAIYLGDYDKAEPLLQQSLGLLDSTGVEAKRALPLGYLAIISSVRGDYEQVLLLAEETLALCRADDNPSGMAFCLNQLGIVAQKRGDYARATDYLAESLHLYQVVDDLSGVARLHNNLGNVAQAQQQYSLAKEHYLRSYALFKEMSNPNGMAATLSNTGFVAWKLGEYEEAKQLHLESLSLKQVMNDRRSIATSLANLGELFCSCGEYTPAAQYFREALQLAEALKLLPLQLDILAGMAELYAQLGSEPQALALLRLTSTHSASTKETRERSAARLPTLTDYALPNDDAIPTLEEAVALALRQQGGVLK